MRVLFICGTYPPARCGIGDYTKELANELDNIGVNTYVLTSVEYRDTANPKILSVIKDWKSWYTIDNIYKHIRELECDIVNIQWPTVKYFGCHNLILLVTVLRCKGIKVVLTLHEFTDCSIAYQLARIPSILSANSIVVVEKRYIESITRIIPIGVRKKIKFIGVGSSIPSSIASTDDLIALRNMYSEGRNIKIITHFGFINKAKRIDIALKALGELKKRGYDFLFIVASSINEASKECQESFWKQVEVNRLMNNVRITGFLRAEKIADILKASDAVISLFETGVSTKNTSFLAAVKQGVDVFATKPVSELGITANNINYVQNDYNELANVLEKKVFSRIAYIKPPFSKVPSYRDIAQMHKSLYESVIG